jgi:hypothetical protein
MKTRTVFHIFLCLTLGFSSCVKDEGPKYDSSNIEVLVDGVLATQAFVIFGADEIDKLGDFSYGICYAADAEPTYQDNRYEIAVNPDTLTESYVYGFYLMNDLSRSTTYKIKGFVKVDNNVFYSAVQSFKTPANSLLLDVSYNYGFNGYRNWLVLSKNGTPLVTQEFYPGDTYAFTDNVPDVADLSIIKLNQSLGRLYVETYTDVSMDAIYLNNPNGNYQGGSATVTVSDLSDFLSWGVASSWWWSTAITPTTTTLSVPLTNYSDNLFIHYLPSDGSAPRYKIANGVTVASNSTYSMADFSTMTDYSNVALPANNYFTYTLAGFNTDYYTEFKRFHGYSFASGYPGTFKLYYPNGVNTNYYFYSFYNTDNTQSFYNKLGSMPTTFFETFPDITIENSSQFKTTTSTIADYSKYDVMDFCGYFQSAGLYVQWDYYKKPMAVNSLLLPEFPDDVRSQFNNISVNDLAFHDVGYFDFINSTVSDYETYVDYLIKQSSRFYDVVKERRYYFKWVNTKSVGEKELREDMKLPDEI